MIEFIDTLKKWSENTKVVMLARVIKTWGSSPRPIGSSMIIHPNGTFIGSVSGGCVEGSVAKQAIECLQNNQQKILSYGVTDEDAWSVGLSCGGSIQVFIQPISLQTDSIWQNILHNSSNNVPSTLITCLEENNPFNVVIQKDIDTLDLPTELKNVSIKAYNERSNQLIEIDEKSYFIQIFPPKPLLLIIGAAHITVDLVSFANQFGFETIVIDPRGYFTQNTLFTSQPDKLIEAYPSKALTEFTLDAYTFCAILSHDPKIDDNALEVLLPSNVAYIGALGSKKTHAKRISRLKEKGIEDHLIDKIHGPIGMPIHAKTAKEIAFSVMGEIIQVKNKFL